jgi:hypothetical protein
VLGFPAAAPGAGVRAFRPVAGAYVTRAYPNTTPRLRTRLVLDAHPIRRGYLRFSVHGVTGRVVRATLRVRTLTRSRSGFEVRYQAGRTWSERRITYRNAPRPGHRIGSSGSFAAGRRVSVDVTRAVRGNGIVSFVLTTRSWRTIALAGRRAGPRSVPGLVVRWARDGEPGGGAGAAGQPQPPAPADGPAITGNTWDKQALTAVPGTWTGTQPISFSYRWRRCKASGQSCADISRATAATYVLRSADIGSTVRVVVTASNAAGSRAATSAASQVVKSAPKAPAASDPPTISGTAQEGAVLTARQGKWTGTQPIALAYQWRHCDGAGRGCVDIAGATATTYTPTASDVGSTIRVAVTGSNATGSTTSVSKATKPVVGLPVAGAKGVTSLWHMDELSGTTMIDSAGANNGTIKNVLLGQDGFQGKGYAFNGTNSLVEVPSSSDLNPGSGAFTLTVHAKFTGRPPTDTWDLIRKGYSTTSGGDYKLEIKPSGQASCHWRGSSGTATVATGPVVADGSWHKLQCIRQPASVTLVVDDSSYPKAVTIGSIANSASLFIGSKGQGTDWFQGLLDEVSVSL